MRRHLARVIRRSPDWQLAGERRLHRWSALTVGHVLLLLGRLLVGIVVLVLRRRLLLIPSKVETAGHGGSGHLLLLRHGLVRIGMLLIDASLRMSEWLHAVVGVLYRSGDFFLDGIVALVQH